MCHIDIRQSLHYSGGWRQSVGVPGPRGPGMIDQVGIFAWGVVKAG